MTPPTPHFLMLTDAAAIAGVGTHQLRKAAEEGEVRHRRLPGPGDKLEICSRDLQRWMEQRITRKKKVLQRLDAERKELSAAADVAVQSRWKKKRRRPTPSIGDVAAGELNSLSEE